MAKEKNQIAEAINLMSRMNLLEDVEKPKRQQVGRDGIIRILDEADKTNAGCYISLTYASGKSFYNTKAKWRKDDMTTALNDYSPEGNEHWYPQIKQFNDDETGTIKKLKGIAGIVMITKYVLHWTTRPNFKKQYGAYREKLSNLRMRNGIGIATDGTLGDAHHTVDNTDATGSLDLNNKGNLEKRLNVIGTPPSKTSFYVVGEDGSILGTIPNNVVNSMNPIPSYDVKPEKDVAAALQGEALELYMSEKAELDKEFKAKAFLMDKTVAIVATVNGVPYYYINDAVKVETKDGSGLFVKPESLVKLAQNQLSELYDEVNNYDPAMLE